MAGRREIEFDDVLFEPDDFLRVRISTVGGVVVAFTMQLETTIAEHRIAVVRYDAQHGQPHRDLLNRRGDVIDKRWLEMSNEEALNSANSDLRTNWSRYKAAFLEEPR